MSRTFGAVVSFAALFVSTFPIAAQPAATKKLTLPEFRDISAWKGRTGLTLFSPDGRFVTVSAKSVDIVVYDTADGREVCKIDGKGFRAFSFSPDSKFAMAQNTADSSVDLFDLADGKLQRSIRGLGKLSGLSKALGGSGIINEVNGIYPSAVLEMGRVPMTPDGRSLLVNKNDSEFSLIDLDTGDLKFDLEHAEYKSGKESAKLVLAILAGLGGSPAGFFLLGSLSNPQFSHDGRFLMIANGNKKPTLWDLSSGKLVSKFDAGERVFYTRFSPDGTKVATSDFDGITKVWNTETGEMISTIGSKKDRGIIAGWDPSGSKVMVSPYYKGDLRAYDAASGTSAYSFQNSQPAGAIFDNDLSLIVTVPRKEKTVLFQIWETSTGRLLATAPRKKGEGRSYSLKWSPDGMMIASASGPKAPVKLWALDGTLLQELDTSTVPMEFSSDGRFLATGGVANAGKDDLGFVWELSSVRTLRQ